MPDKQASSQARRAEAESQSDIDILTSKTGKSFLEYIVGMFAAVGGGYGVGLIILSIVEGNVGAIVGVFAFFIPVLGAPVIAMITGLYTGLGLDTTRRKALVVSAAGGFIGFFVLLLTLLASASIAADERSVAVFLDAVFNPGNRYVDGGGGGAGGGGGNPISELFVPLIAFGIGVAVTAAGATYIVRKTDVENIH